MDESAYRRWLSAAACYVGCHIALVACTDVGCPQGFVVDVKTEKCIRPAVDGGDGVAGSAASTGIMSDGIDQSGARDVPAGIDAPGHDAGSSESKMSNAPEELCKTRRPASVPDQCCPPGADVGTDPDCNPVCGDGLVSGSETCDPVASCPNTCDSENACLRAELVGDPAVCTAKCDLIEVTDWTVHGAMLARNAAMCDWQRTTDYPPCTFPSGHPGVCINDAACSPVCDTDSDCPHRVSCRPLGVYRFCDVWDEINLDAAAAL